MLPKMSRAVAVETPNAIMVYATNCVSMAVQITFPAEFTPEDRARVRQALVDIYDLITDQHDQKEQCP